MRKFYKKVTPKCRHLTLEQIYGLPTDPKAKEQRQEIRDIYNRLGLTPNLTPTGITNTNLGMFPMQRDLVKTGRLQEFQNLPPAYIQSLLEDEEAMYP